MGFTVSKQTGTWLLIFTIVGVILAGIQIVRVNNPGTTEVPVQRPIYTDAGPFLPGQVEVGANDFSAHKIHLNHRMKLSGPFRTANLRSRVSVLVIREADLESWQSGAEVKPVVRTNIVPGGKISPMLEPGVYFLIIDNRASDQPQTVSTEFVIE